MSAIALLLTQHFITHLSRNIDIFTPDRFGVIYAAIFQTHSVWEATMKSLVSTIHNALIMLLIIALLVSACGNNDSPGNNTELTAISDEFDTDLSAWTTLNSSAATVSIDSGQMVIEPQANTLWFQTSAGILQYQLVSGNFIVSAYLTTRRASDANDVPINTNFGGLMAHDPATSTSIQNYVHAAIGSIASEAGPVAEHKTTVNGTSTYVTTTWPSAEGELRICRIGELYNLYIRPRDGTWQLLAQHTRSDLPDTLEIGAMAYSDSSGDLRASFEYVRFQSASTENDCTS